MKQICTSLLLLVAAGMLQAQTWNGSVNNDWNTDANWTPAGVPAPSGNVIIPGSIPGSYWPAFTGPVSINSIEMQPGSRLDVQGYPLTLYGQFANNTFSGAEINNSNPASAITINLCTGTAGFITYFNGNTVNGHLLMYLTGSSPFIEGNAVTPNVYQGNAVFNIKDALPVYIAYGSPSRFNGHLSIDRTIAGSTSLFYAGAQLAGNFSFTASATAPVWIGNPAITTNIAGTVTISAANTSPVPFEMHRVVNHTPGGSIQVSQSQGFYLQLDTLLVNTLQITGYRGGDYAKLMNNDITGHLSIADDASYGGGFFTYIRNNTIRGNSSFTINGTNSFLEADVAGSGNTYLGDVSFHSAGATLYIGYGARLHCSGNLEIRSAGGGQTSAFNAGASIGGDFTFSNPAAGNTSLGNVLNRTTIGGALFITADYPAPAVFEMYRLLNNTGGGQILVQRSMGFTLRQDTLQVNTLTITGYRGNNYGTLENSAVTGDLFLEDDAGYGGGFYTYIRGNTLTGNSRFTFHGTNALLEGDQPGSGNTYHGNLDISATGSAALMIAYQSPLFCSGNLSIERSATGGTLAFHAGATINGDFRYRNSSGGGTTLGNPDNTTSIGGRVDVTAAYPSPEAFNLYRFINHTGGGTVRVMQSLGFEVKYNSLLLDSLIITGYRGNNYSKLENNTLTGYVRIADDAGYAGGFYTSLRSNVINGHSSFSLNGANGLLEADQVGSGNTYNGNLLFTVTGSGDLVIAYQEPLNCTGHLTIQRTGAGNTLAFKAGATIGGNVSYTLVTSGNTQLGDATHTTTVGGSLEILISNSIPGQFSLYGLKNLAGGGQVDVQNAAGFDVQNNQLLLRTFSITGYRGNSNDYLIGNTITGDLVLADDASYTGGFYVYIRNNVITGNSHIANHGTNSVVDADLAGTGNRYLGNLTFLRTNGLILAGINDADEVTGNLTLDAAANTGLGKFKFTGSGQSVIEQLGTQPLQLAECTIQKTGSGSILLNDQVSISGTVQFLNGLIHTSAGKELIFLDDAGYTGASNASFVNGPCNKTGNDAFVFPVGKGTMLAPVSISAPALNTDVFSAEYFAVNPHTAGFDTALKSPGLHHVSALEYWMLNRTAGTARVSVGLSWQSVRSGEVNDLPGLTIARWDGNTWTNEGNGGTTGNLAEGTIITAAPVMNFSPFTLASSGVSNPLPVSFISFTATLQADRSVWLRWTTASEYNNARFEVERSTDGLHWVTCGVLLPAATGEYAYLDKGAAAPVCYYRIKQSDNDRRSMYSAVRIIRLNNTNQLVVWPNPARDYLYVQSPEARGSLYITDPNGRIVLKAVIRAAVTCLPVHQLAAGIYHLRVSSRDSFTTLSFVKE